jgi:hypothetical protein
MIPDQMPGFASHGVLAKSIGEKGHPEDGGGAITQLKLPRSKNRKVKERIEEHRKGRPSKKK